MNTVYRIRGRKACRTVILHAICAQATEISAVHTEELKPVPCQQVTRRPASQVNLPIFHIQGRWSNRSLPLAAVAPVFGTIARILTLPSGLLHSR